jgi:class 3 adenylate cyclase
VSANSDDTLFDLYDREKRLLAEGPDLLKSSDENELRAFSERLFERFAKVVRENEDLTRHSDRQEQRLVKLNQNLKLQTRELDQRKTELENLSHQLSKYLPPQIHQALFEGKHDTQITTQRKKLTVFFSDIKNFTQTSESLQPEALTEYLNEYFSEMTQIALNYGATIDKYMGDAMMVFFGDPESHGVREDARACVEMALSMLERLRSLQKRWHSIGFENPFEIRIGINTGYCNVGNFGSEQRLSYTIIGGEVNLAQRLESNADVGGILMSYETFVHVEDLVVAEKRGAIIMKGIARDVQTYSITGRKTESSPSVFNFDHPAGVSIDLDPAVLDAEVRSALADKLSELASQLREP